MHYVYILESTSTSRRYIGCAEDVAKRVRQHNKKSVRSTKAFVPWRLVYTEKFPTKTEARKRENELKGNTWKRSELFAKLFPSSAAPSSNGQDSGFSSR